jgi:hypothetical protein
MRSISKLKINVKRDFQEWLEKTLSNCRYIPRKTRRNKKRLEKNKKRFDKLKKNVIFVLEIK